MTEITFEVEGLPMPQGSHTAVSRGGKPALIPAGTSTSRKAFATWRGLVADAAADMVPDDGPLDGPLEVSVTFRLPMPGSRNADTRRAGWAWAATKPDLDKLVRAVGDSLVAGGLIRDDARIVRITAEKVEINGTWCGAEIAVRPCTRDWA